MPPPLFNRTWTLFLDRDGVINQEKKADYINHWSEFIFYPNAIEAIATLSSLFYKTIVVTNQKGVGRGITSITALNQIHNKMLTEIENGGGKIDKIYHCPAIENDSPCRKPNAGMAFEAVKDYPNIQLSKSIMIGNNASDLQFGINAGMACTILLTTTQPLSAVEASLYHYHFDSLHQASIFLKSHFEQEAINAV